MRLVSATFALFMILLFIGESYQIGKGPFYVNTKMLKGFLNELDMNIEDIDLDIFKQLFIQYDKDSNYKLSYEEFEQLYWEEGGKVPLDVTQYHFYHADANKDEVLDFEEILLFSVGSMTNFYERTENSRPNWVHNELEAESQSEESEGEIETYSPNPNDRKETVEL